MNAITAVAFWIIIVIIVLSLLHPNFLQVMGKETADDVSHWVKTFEGAVK